MKRRILIGLLALLMLMGCGAKKDESVVAAENLIRSIGDVTLEKDRLPTPVFLGFCLGSAGKESAFSEGDLGLIPGLGRSAGEGKGYPLQYSGLENSMDCIVHGVAKNRTRLSDFNFSLGLRLSYTTLPLWPQSSHG